MSNLPQAFGTKRQMIDLGKLIRDVPDFPKPGIMFKDITPLLREPMAIREASQQLCEPFRGKQIDLVAGIESRGFIFGAMVADCLGAGFVPIRKPGKLPHKKIAQSYELEYGTNTVELHTDAVGPGQKVLIIDDLLATGGTMKAACQLVETLGGIVAGTAFVVELCFLDGRKRLEGYPIHALIQVP